jgi:hypothetical protein
LKYASVALPEVCLILAKDLRLCLTFYSRTLFAGEELYMCITNRFLGISYVYL